MHDKNIWFGSYNNTNFIEKLSLIISIHAYLPLHTDFLFLLKFFINLKGNMDF